MESFPNTKSEPLASPSGTPIFVAPAEAPAVNAAATTVAAPRIRRRNRMITSCLECRRRKLKCDKSHPCTNCLKFTRDCVFLAPALDQASQLKLTEIKEKVGSLERLLERHVAQDASVSSPTQGRALPEDSEDYLPANEDERDLEPTPLATVDAAYELDGEDDDLLDLGIQLGRMRITERIGGFFRPKISEELEYTISDPKRLLPHETSRSPSASNPSPSASAPEWLKPGPAYITPSSGFFFGSGNITASVIDYLPSRLAADRLIKQYFDFVHPICQIVHRPTFEREYEAFWHELTLGIEPPTSVQAIVFSAMFSAAVSLDESVIVRDFGVGKSSLLDNFKLGSETALSRANFLRTTKTETLQAFVMYLIPLCRSELSRAHSVLVGAAIRMAECMGLHRDGESYGTNPLETHTRRLIWYQLCFLDIRTCEAQGPRPTIRRDEFDTKLPINADDIEFHASGPPPVVADRWTDATLCLIRFEINEMMRTIWTDRPRIESRKISLTAVLSKIETFRSKMAAKYDHLMDERVPIQKCAKIIKTLLISRLHIMVLHRYHNSVVLPMPDRLKAVMVGSAVTTCEMAILLETTSELKPWTWYGGAFNQYHTAFLLLMEVYVNPHRQGADRIWQCLDYIFECDPSEPQSVKGKKILSELQQKTAIYQSMRGMRAPVVMQKYVGQRPPRVADKSARDQNLKYLSSPGGMGGSLQRSPPPMVEAASSVGRFPIPEMQFAGVTNGESLWALPHQNSPESVTDSLSNAESAGGNGGALFPSVGKEDVGLDLMADIDWEAFDALFPPEHRDLTMSSFQPPPGSYHY